MVSLPNHDTGTSPFGRLRVTYEILEIKDQRYRFFPGSVGMNVHSNAQRIV